MSAFVVEISVYVCLCHANRLKTTLISLHHVQVALYLHFNGSALALKNVLYQFSPWLPVPLEAHRALLVHGSPEEETQRVKSGCEGRMFDLQQFR